MSIRIHTRILISLSKRIIYSCVTYIYLTLTFFKDNIAWPMT